MTERPGATEPVGAGKLARVAWGFVALGVVLRVLLYLSNPPLWGDEACLAFNLLDRGYGDLLRPLDYGQVAPPLFLWIERASVGLFGFSEPSLRLFPLSCGVASLFLFHRLATRTLGGVAGVLAVAIFAVSSHPIRHASDVKPYASDLLMALVLLGPALAWLRRRDHDTPLWMLAGLTPFALLMSYPAAFVAGGIGIGLAWPVWGTGRASARRALASFGAVAAATSLAVFALVARAQAGAVRTWMDLYWARAFPPSGTWAFARWLFLETAGSMLSYPEGGRQGGSTPTLVLVAVAAVAMIRGRRRAECLVLLSPFALVLAAATGHKYPYGGEARTMQFVAPGICLLAGLGMATLLGRVPKPESRRGALTAVLILLAGLGIVLTGKGLVRPYRSAYDRRVRDFAREFWPAQARGAEVACLRRDFGIVEDLYARRGMLNGRMPVFVCNQAIYSPGRRDGGPHPDRVSAEHPLRCILYHEMDLNQPEVAAWLASMKGRYDLAGAGRFEVDVADPGGPPNRELIHTFDFIPKRGEAPAEPDMAAAARPGSAGASPTQRSDRSGGLTAEKWGDRVRR